MAQYKFESLRAEYTALWAKMQVVKTAEASAQARKIILNKSRYKAVEKTTGVPWFVIGCLHMRESNGDFNTWLHNGDPMRHNGVPVRTVHVPANRPPDPNVTWEQGAYDALVIVEHFDEIKEWGPEHVAYAAESFNGFGYRNPARNIPSPYLWGGTSVQKPGKFVRDGVYDASVMDPQIGAMAVLKQIMQLDAEAKFEEAVPPAPPEPAPPIPPSAPTPISPKADDTDSQTKPITQSKSLWGGIGGWLTAIGSSIFAGFQYIATPWGFAALALIILVASVFLYLVIKGRIDIGNIVKHLSQDDTPPKDQ